MENDDRIVSKDQYFHFRFFNDGTVEPKGGVTIAYRNENGASFFGTAVCSPNDTYNKKRGRAMAMGRSKSKGDKEVYNEPLTYNQCKQIAGSIAKYRLEQYPLNMVETINQTCGLNLQLRLKMKSRKRNKVLQAAEA